MSTRTSIHMNAQELEAVITMVKESGNELLGAKLELMEQRLERLNKPQGQGRVLSNTRIGYRGSKKSQVTIRRVSGEELATLFEESEISLEVVDPATNKVRILDAVLNEDKVRTRVDIPNNGGKGYRSVYSTLKSDVRDQFLVVIEG